MPPCEAGRAPEQRASDADRDTAVEILCAAVADGRLTLAELGERVEAALCARTLTELATLIADLPGRHFTQAVAAQAGAPTARPDERAASRWSLIQSMLGPDRAHPAL